METITNQAQVSFSYEGSSVTRTNVSNIVNSTVKDEYSILVEKTATTDCFRAGDVITYIVHVTNNGCGCLSGFTVTDNLGGEDYATFVEGSARIFIGGSMRTIVPTEVSPLTFEFSDRLDRDAEFILEYNVFVNENISVEVNEITNEVTVHGYACGCGCNRNKACVEGTATYTISKCEYAEVLITKAVSNDNVCCGEELDYIITLTNTGSVDATNVVVTDLLPTSFTVMEIHSENNGVHYKYDESEYDVSDANLLTLPNETGTAIYVPAIAPGVDNTTRVRIHGHM